MNKQEILDQITALLTSYININTAEPEPAYDEAITLFIDHAQKDNLSYNKIVLDSGLPMLVVSIEGSDKSLKSIVLNHHMDVVPAQKEGWITPPFDGKIIDHKLYGRGTQDMKSVGVCHYYALKHIMQSGKKPKRTIHLTMVPDEERGGFGGTGQFVKHSLFQNFNIGYVIDEGMPSGIENTIFISTAERKPLQIIIEVQGTGGHASRLLHHNPVHVLLEILQQLMTLHQHSMSMACNDQTNNVGQYDSFHITSLKTFPVDNAVNSIATSASATIDIRLAPHSSIQKMVNSIHTIVASHDTATWQIIAAAEEHMPAQQEPLLENTLSMVLAKQRFFVQKRIFEGASDMRFYRALAIEAVGCTPFTDLPLLHASNENISLESLYNGYNIFVSLLEHFCY